jgi:proliferating cell nuclear antigen
MVNNNPYNLINLYFIVAKEKCEFELSLIDLTTENVKTENIEYDSTIYLTSDFYKKICAELYTLSDTVNITTKKSYVSFRIESQDFKGEITLRDNNSNFKKLGEQCEITVFLR